MNFLLTQNNFVVVGPKPWNKYAFEDILENELEIPTILPKQNSGYLEISESIKFFPVTMDSLPPMNPKIHQLAGPYYTYTSNSATGYYTIVNRPLEQAKSDLKSTVADTRYKKEIAGVKTTIQGIEITVDTMRGNRDVFVQKFLLMSDTDVVQWKFPEGWLSLTKTELGQAVMAGVNHVQTQFINEAVKINEIDNCTTLEELDLVDIS